MEDNSHAAVRVGLRLFIACAGAALVASCGGADSPGQVGCSASFQPSDAILLPAVNVGSDTFQYTLTRAATADAPHRFSAQLQLVNAPSDCSGGNFVGTVGSTLVAENMERFGQESTATFVQATVGDQMLFDLVSGSVTGGNLDAHAGGVRSVANAQVTVTSNSGAPLLTGTTNGNGAVIAMLGSATLPDSFNVTVSGGTVNGVAFNGTLRAAVDDYSTASEPFIDVTPLTTLMSAYSRRHPELGPEAAKAAVESFLSVPSEFDIEPGHEAVDNFFDESAFYAQAEAFGNFDAFVQRVIADWDAGTVHNFLPALQDLGAPSAIEQAVLPPELLPPGTTPEPDGPPPVPTALLASSLHPQDGAIAFSIIGKIWDSYKDSKVKEFQADVIDSLRRMERQLDATRRAAENTKRKSNEAVYLLKQGVIDPMAGKVAIGLGCLRWLAEYQDPGTMSAADWQNLHDKKLECVKTVTAEETATSKPTVPPDWLLTYKGALNGKFGTDGLFTAYRDFIISKVEERIYGTPQARGFFTWQDSALMWEHYHYYTNVGAVAFLFYANKYYAEKDTKNFNDLQTDFAAALEGARKQMPERALPTYTYIDTVNTDFYDKKVGGPMLWYFGPYCDAALTMDTRNVTVQSDIAIKMNCFNYYVGGIGGFRLGTWREWEAMTQTANNPGTNVGKWLYDRGVVEVGANGEKVNRNFYYVTLGTDCTDSYVQSRYAITCRRVSPPYKPSFMPTYFFETRVTETDVNGGLKNGDSLWTWVGADTRSSWQPFIWFNVAHVLGNWSQAGGKGLVIPAREVRAGEFY